MEKKGEIVFTKYGPYTVVDLEVYGKDGKKIEGPRVFSLCRCGESKNKPFCDGTHHDTGFKD